MGHLLAEESNGHIRLGLVGTMGEAHKCTMVRTAGCVLGSTGLGIHNDFALQRPDTVCVGVLVAPAAEILGCGTTGNGDNLLHAFLVGLDGGRSHFQLALDLGLIFVNQIAVVRGNHTAQEGRLHTGALVGQSGNINCQLHGGVPVFALTDGAQNTVTCGKGCVNTGFIDFLLDFFGIVPAQLFVQLDAGGNTQTQCPGSFCHHVTGHTPT